MLQVPVKALWVVTACMAQKIISMHLQHVHQQKVMLWISIPGRKTQLLWVIPLIYGGMLSRISVGKN